MLRFSKPLKRQPTPADVTSEQQTNSPIKYLKPSVLLLDMEASVSDAASRKGFNITTGTLGRPYKVDKASRYSPVIGIADVPDHAEHDIVIADFKFQTPEDGPSGEKHRPDEETDLWGKCDKGYLDPRVRAAVSLQESFDRILYAGGVFIIFADEKTESDLITARVNFGTLINSTPFPFDIWSLLTELSTLDVVSDSGREIQIVGSSPLAELLQRHLDGSSFACRVASTYKSSCQWEPLAKNKYKQTVALCGSLGENRVSIIVLPQIRDKATFVSELLVSVLPEIAPRLFPFIEGGKWTNWPEYELPRILEVASRKREVEERAARDLAALDEEVSRERAVNGWLHHLLTGTDAELVDAVKKSLATLNFSSVVDVDAERDREGKTRREDLQIADRSPLLIVDIKGISGFPSDEDALQADKHATIRMRELGRTDVVGLSIINHQRHLPPLERENTMPFRQELLDVANERMLGLMTSWDLYRIVLNFRSLGWRPEDVQPLFYKKGRIDVVPDDYQYVGTIQKVWTSAFGIVISEGEVELGDVVAVELLIVFKELSVTSLQVDSSKVAKVSQGDRAGLPWEKGWGKLREGMRVFRKRRQS